MTAIVLASTSRYRAELLRRLQLPFTQQAPGTDERPLAGETPLERAQRLASAKARDVARQHPAAIVIGSDQVAELDGRVLDKPGTAAVAVEQLRASSGREVVFHTALAVVHGDDVHRHVDRTVVRFRVLTEAEISSYVQREQPFDCAGSFKCEGLGISLFESIRNDDPTALIGLPLIAVARLLRQCGALP